MSNIKKDFTKYLKHLQHKRRDLIESLTSICVSNTEHAQTLAETIFEEFKEAKVERKEALLFLLDSILKTCKDKYLIYIQQGVTDAFFDAYAASKNYPDIRQSLRILFKTWEIHFSGITITSIRTKISVQLGEDIEASLTVEDFDNLIIYYRKHGLPTDYLELQKKMKLGAAPGPVVNTVRKVEKKVPKEKTSSLIIPPEMEALLNPKIEKKPTSEEVPKPIKKVPKQMPPKVTSPPQTKPMPQNLISQQQLTAENTGGYKIRKKERERTPLDKEEHAFNPVIKSVKTEAKSALGPRHEEPHHLGGYGGGMQQGTGYMYNRQAGGAQENPSRHMMQPQTGQRQYGGYYPQQQQSQGGFEEEAQFSDDETSSFQQGKPSQGLGGQFQGHNKYQSQPRSQLPRDQHQQQHMRMQHQPYHGGHQQQQPHTFQPQTQMGQYPQQGQMQQQQQQQRPVQSKGSMPGQMHGGGQSQPIHHMQQQQQQPHPTEFQPHYSGQQQPSKGRQAGGESGQFQPLSPQTQMHPHYSQHQMASENIAQQQQQQQSHLQQKVPGSQLEKLKQIKQLIDNSRTPAGGESTTGSARTNQEGGSMPDFEFPCAFPSQKRNDSFLEAVSARKDSDLNEQSNVLVFKSLLSHIKRQFPDSVKMKYEQKFKKTGRLDLSSMLGRRDFNVVESIYEELPYRCSSCGLRFTNRTLLNKHLDWHFQFNMEMKEKTKTMNLRPQLITTDHWIKDEGNKNYKGALNIENAEEEYEFENYVPGNEVAKSCRACGEVFKEVWDKTKEVWLLDGAAKVKYEEEENGEGGKQKGSNFDLMHFRCYKLCLQNETK